MLRTQKRLLGGNKSGDLCCVFQTESTRLPEDFQRETVTLA